MRKLFRRMDSGIEVYCSAPYITPANRVIIDLRFERAGNTGRTDVFTTFLPDLPKEKIIGFAEEEADKLVSFARGNSNDIWNFARES